MNINLFVDLKWVFRLLRVNEASRFSLMKLYDFNAMGFEKLVNQSCLIVIPYQLERIEELILSVSTDHLFFLFLEKFREINVFTAPQCNYICMVNHKHKNQ